MAEVTIYVSANEGDKRTAVWAVFEVRFGVKNKCIFANPQARLFCLGRIRVLSLMRGVRSWLGAFLTRL